MNVAECSLTSCVWGCFQIDSHTMPGQQHSQLTPTSLGQGCMHVNSEMEHALNDSQHTKLPLEKKIFLPLLLGFEFATFWSWVWCCSNMRWVDGQENTCMNVSPGGRLKVQWKWQCPCGWSIFSSHLCVIVLAQPVGESSLEGDGSELVDRYGVWEDGVSRLWLNNWALSVKIRQYIDDGPGSELLCVSLSF